MQIIKKTDLTFIKYNCGEFTSETVSRKTNHSVKEVRDKNSKCPVENLEMIKI